MAEKGIEAEAVVGAGMDVPGAVLHDRYVDPCVNLNGWGGNVADALSERATSLSRPPTTPTLRPWARCGVAAAKAATTWSSSPWEQVSAAASLWMAR